VDNETVVREKDKLRLLVQGAADEEDGGGWSPALAYMREGGVATAAKTAITQRNVEVASLTPAFRELVDIGVILTQWLAGFVAVIPSDVVYHVRAVMSAPSHLSPRGN
jgi:hypothetical protein